MKVAASWSGGKDSCLATYAAISEGLEVSQLVSYTYEDASGSGSSRILKKPLSHISGRIIRASPSFVLNLASFVYKDLSKMIPHEVAPEIIALQSQAMEMPLIQTKVRWDTFEQYLKSCMKSLKQKGIEGIIFGVVPPHFPIDSSEKLREYRTLLAHKEWMNRICNEAGITPITPLWDRTPERILKELVTKGFETIIVVVDSKYLGEEWLGRKIDKDFVDEIRRLNRERSVHVGGSEYHTLVIDGPMFKRRLKVVQSRKIWKNGYGILDLSKVELAKK